MIRSQDLVTALAIRLVVRSWSYPALSDFTGLSISQSHMSCSRLREAGLLRQDPGEAWLVSASKLTEFLSHGVPYVFPGRIGEPTRGIPTAYAVDFVAKAFVSDQATPVVWPTMDGETKGSALDPLHPCQLRCIAKPGGESIYRALVCVDLLRIGQARERTWAKDYLSDLLKHAGG